MGRLIDADALINYCNNQKDKTIDANDIARFPTAVSWVSVKDRLSDNDENVIVCYEWIGRFSGHTYREITCTTIKECEMDGYRIIAWMPLPEPPKEVENEI